MSNVFPRAPRRMAYSKATRLMRRFFHAHMEADRRGVPVQDVLQCYKDRSEILGQYARGGLSRRAFVRLMGLTGATMASLATAPLLGPAKAQAGARVVVIGAGLSGVRCAHLLGQHSIVADVYEASSRIGGRTYSDTTSFPGEVIEHGGSFVSTEHNALRNLVNNLGLKLEVVNGGELLEGEEIYSIDGEFYTEEEADEDWEIAWRAFKDELHLAPWPQTYDVNTPRGVELDNMPVSEWFDSNPILAQFGSESRLAKLCYSDMLAEYGADYQQQPALNLLYLLAWNPIGSITPLPGTDEFYHIIDGSQAVVDNMAPDLLGEIHLDKELVSITGAADGPYTCGFADGTQAVADKLVLTLPFRILRDVSIAPAIWNSFRPEKRLAISKLPMGTNAKIHIRLSDRTWGPDNPQFIAGEERVLNGVAYSDPAGFQCIWDDSVPKPDGAVFLLYYPGGTQGANLRGRDAFGTASAKDVKRVLAQVETVFPGTSAAYTGEAIQSHWAASPWHKGAYSYWGIGGYTSYVGAAELPESNIHFAGEHTSVEYQGYMEGAVRSGERAAKEIFQSL